MEQPIGKRIDELDGRSGTITAVSGDGTYWTVDWNDGSTDDVHIACVVPADAFHVFTPVSPSSDDAS